MQNEKSKRIQQLRHDAADEDRSPKDRIKSAERLLSEFGPTGRNLPFINDVIRQFLKDPSYDNQLRAQKLKAKLISAQELKDAAAVELPEPEITTNEQATPIIAGTSASEVPITSMFSFDSIRQAFTDTIGAALWHQFSQGQVDLTAEQRKSVLGGVLKTVSIESVRSLIVELYKPNERGWTLAGSFPDLIRIAQDFLREQHGITVVPPPSNPAGQTLLDLLNSKRAGVSHD